MRQEGSPLDLNHLPDEYGKHALEESSTTTAVSADSIRIKKKGGGKDEGAKVYECRFCSLKFCKSQALGGHMNRHRQERETETLNRARQLVFGNEGLAAVAGAHMSLRDVNLGGAQSAILGGFHPRGVVGGGGGAGDPCMPFRQSHPRLSPPPPPYHYLYSPPTLHPAMTYPVTYSAPRPSVGDIVIGHTVAGEALLQQQHRGFSCFGTPLAAPPGAAERRPAAGPQPDAVSCNCGFGCGGHNHVSSSS